MKRAFVTTAVRNPGDKKHATRGDAERDPPGAPGFESVPGNPAHSARAVAGSGELSEVAIRLTTFTPFTSS